MRAMARARQKRNGETEVIAQETIDEARMVLPGIQALFGFQLIAVFNERFRELAPLEQQLHYASLVLVSLAIALIMTPAAYHRIVEQTSVSEFFVRLASYLIAAAMVPLMMAIAIEVYLVGVAIFGRSAVSSVVAGGLLFLLALLWFVIPLIVRYRLKGR
jgi:hypothetical protein